MDSPDGNGSSTGEGRKGALLVLRGGRPTEADGTSERGTALPSSNALRPDSHLNLGWYRPTAPEERPGASGKRDGWSSHDGPRQADEQQLIVTAAATRLDLGAEPSPSDPGDSPLGVRRSSNTLAGSSHEGRRRETGRVPVGVAKVCRSARVRLGSSTREGRKRPLAAGVAAVLLVAAAFAAMTALEQQTRGHRGVVDIAPALNASHLQRQFLSEVSSSLDALTRSEFKASVGAPVQSGPRSHVHRRSGNAPVPASHTSQTTAARASTSSRHSTLVGHTAATSQSVSQSTSSAGSNSGTTGAREEPAETTPVQQAPVQQTSTQQPVHYQPTAQPAGPTGLGSQVGSNCNPKCS